MVSPTSLVQALFTQTAGFLTDPVAVVAVAVLLLVAVLAAVMAAETLSMAAAAELVAMLAMVVPPRAVTARQVLGAVAVAVVGLPVLVVFIIPLVAVAVLVYMAKAPVAQVERHQSHPLPHVVGARDQVVLPDQTELLFQVRLLLVQTEAHLAVVVV